jgi:hypothetical protein
MARELVARRGTSVTEALRCRNGSARTGRWAKAAKLGCSQSIFIDPAATSGSYVAKRTITARITSQLLRLTKHAAHCMLHAVCCMLQTSNFKLQTSLSINHASKFCVDR